MKKVVYVHSHPIALKIFPRFRTIVNLSVLGISNDLPKYVVDFGNPRKHRPCLLKVMIKSTLRGNNNYNCQ